MRKTLLLATSLLACSSAMADWGSFEDPTAMFPMNTNDFGCTYSAGKNILWSCIYDSYLDEEGIQQGLPNTYHFRLQGIRPDGTKVFADELGKDICSYANLSFTMYNNRVFADNEDNAIVMVQDLRNSDDVIRNFSLTLYKVSPEGEMLWGEEGISPNNDDQIQNLTASQGCQLQDGSYVICWQGASTGVSYMQRISNDGKTKYWGEKGIPTSGMYPILIPCEDNQVIMIYYTGAVKAMKYDADGSEAWSKPVTVYAYGFNSMAPPYLFFNARPVKGGGVLVYWRDDRNNLGYYSPYVSYVTADGKLAFQGASDEGDCKLSTSSWFSCMEIRANADPDGDGFVAFWTSNYANMNNYGGMVAQRVNLEGELEWGDEGMEFAEPTNQTNYTPGSILPDDKGNMAYFYDWSEMENGLSGWNNMGVKVRLLNAKTGEPVWKEDLALNAQKGHVSGIEAFNYPEDKCWLATWTRGIYSQKNETRLVQRINYDGELVVNGTGEKVEKITDVENRIKVRRNSDTMMINVNEATKGDVYIYDLTGRLVGSKKGISLNAGNNRIDAAALNGAIGIVRIVTANGSTTVKI